MNVSNRLAVRREFIEVQDVGQEQIPTDCRFQNRVASSLSSFLFLFCGENIPQKSFSSRRTVFQYFRIETSSYCSRDLYQRHYYSLCRCVILLCHCPALRSPGDSNWNRVRLILTLRLSNPCATTMWQPDDINIRIFELTLPYLSLNWI